MEILSHHFTKPDYIPVARKHIENIHIEIKTDQNEPVNFTYGKTIVKLHFRGKTIRRTGHKCKQDIF